MNMEHGAIIIKDVTGDWPVYPGHPLVLATAIMSVFPRFEDANRPTEHGWCQALADSRIPGAGDHVGAAMRVLGLGASGAGTDDMVKAAMDYWDSGNAGGHHKNVEAGRAQAQAVEHRFREMAAVWFAQ
ncbi:hypothetical protein QRD43_21150 [Pelomonas sp. APW6]|uniref:Uncharacterized protein n=1 Tax=Roseateles subflavus TaxID=3053353 RepID=A0ABT7LNS9_9BURK|nr:hypothetical protein [Pelomonas sp. APW6]MDL5034424.1 hypothetical protein [Pelomonas sp. APW6]